jgi:hypothetical protein
MLHFSKLYEKNVILIEVPSTKNDRVKVFIDEILEDNYDIIFKVEIQNKEDFKYLTENILVFYIKSHLELCLKIFSIEKDVKVSFT